MPSSIGPLPWKRISQRSTRESRGMNRQMETVRDIMISLTPLSSLEVSVFKKAFDLLPQIDFAVRNISTCLHTACHVRKFILAHDKLRLLVILPFRTLFLRANDDISPRAPPLSTLTPVLEMEKS
ncbi:hypothetical protein CDAR_111301 [Caerostris darwini]|uniref:Uncharacterized protein n=1 Tax=Caerostris darwini TaxID=1538125 RepID=A0AAV4UBT7_9ARAC|nr:hypothetical protein CDAR_111301 [Caerostris darwini]